jgi:hypothetical protein
MKNITSIKSVFALDRIFFQNIEIKNATHCEFELLIATDTINTMQCLFRTKNRRLKSGSQRFFLDAIIHSVFCFIYGTLTNFQYHLSLLYPSQATQLRRHSFVTFIFSLTICGLDFEITKQSCVLHSCATFRHACMQTYVNVMQDFYVYMMQKNKLFYLHFLLAYSVFKFLNFIKIAN